MLYKVSAWFKGEMCVGGGGRGGEYCDVNIFLTVDMAA